MTLELSVIVVALLRTCQARFWYGFCVKLVDLGKEDRDAWDERFDHIDSHFMGYRGLLK
jgi:hypothetical protein